MQYSTIPFTLVDHDQAFILDVDALYAHAATLTDGRKPRGCRYSLALLLTVAVLAKLAGFVRMEDLADWAKLRHHELQHFFGTTRTSMPHHTTWSRVLGKAVDVDELDQLVQRLLAPPPVGQVPDRCSIHVALDGKTLRGSRKQGAPAVHLLSALAHHLGITLAQQAVSDKTNEITQVEAVLRQLVLPGRVFTMSRTREIRGRIVDPANGFLRHC